MRPQLAFVQLLAFSVLALAALLAPVSNGEEPPPEVQVDRLLVQAEREIKDGEHWSAVVTFERILAVCEEHGLAIPAEFWFRQAGVLNSAGLHERAIEASTRYLTEAGRDGKNYQAALELLDAAEVGLAEARRETEAAERAAREVETRQAAITPSAPEMVVIPAGTFRMGCASNRWHCDYDEWPVREVRIDAFEISKHEVTFKQWDICVEYGGCRSVEDEGWGRNDRPVINVTWEDAQAYAVWLSKEMGEAFRLPSEAEWEYAARAGTETMYNWGNDRGRGLANCDGCRCDHCGSRTSPVGSYPQNPFGLHDMHGNVWEWVADCWNESYQGAPSDGSAWLLRDCERRVLRGGSWINRPGGLRSANRGSVTTSLRSSGSVTTSFRSSSRGFRVARVNGNLKLLTLE